MRCQPVDYTFRSKEGGVVVIVVVVIVVVTEIDCRSLKPMSSVSSLGCVEPQERPTNELVHIY